MDVDPERSSAIMGMLRITDSTGDTRLPWDENSLDAVKAVFDRNMGKGYAAFKDAKQRIKEFDPDAEEIIMVAPIQAG
jgi:hypothetical protein